ncbi:MAG TPA: hypothetical protein DCZ94_11710 [Lentisphaeria bacterium]|nr:MAG: hypothetical protein A2X48_09690 [Lentisphaerae bacterium GWF2_49_21]HBC87613.1 hypothetical protein [Lentisphaeria bacterium]
MSDTAKTVSRVINVVVIIGICVGAFILYQKIQSGKSKVEEIKRLEDFHSGGQWQDCLNEYEKLSAKYPEMKGQYDDKLSACYQGIAQDKYTKSLSLSIAEKPKVAGDICAAFEKAAGIGKLSQLSIESYCDALMDAGNFDKAAQVIKDAEARTDIDAGKLLVYKTRLQRKK